MFCRKGTQDGKDVAVD
ncbi:Protein of unknown function [Bacillus cereus]|nr:Protein of unknown function [Bacillus cereus]SCN42081.1 Protein of unknown function [Bacillus wiedmannii]